MKLFFLTLILSLGFINQLFGQFGVSYEMRKAFELYNTNKFISGSAKSTLFEVDYTGSPYLNDKFINGSIFTTQKIQFEEVPLRYNIYNDELEFKTPEEEILALATPEIVEKAVLGDTILSYLTYLKSNKLQEGFFIILEEGKASLYAKPDVMYQKATKPGAYKDPEPAKFIKKRDDYYLQIGNGQAQIINNKKNLIEAFPDNNDKVESFIAKNKTKINKAESLIELFQYYNSL